MYWFYCFVCLKWSAISIVLSVWKYCTHPKMVTLFLFRSQFENSWNMPSSLSTSLQHKTTQDIYHSYIHSEEMLKEWFSLFIEWYISLFWKSEFHSMKSGPLTHSLKEWKFTLFEWNFTLLFLECIALLEIVHGTRQWMQHVRSSFINFNL